MSTQSPLSLGEVKRLAGSVDTIRLRAVRDADLETPIGAFLRLDDGVTPAYLLESVEGGERLGRYSFLGIGPRRLLEVRGGRAMIQDRPVGVVDYTPDLPVAEHPTDDPLAALRAFLPRRRVEPTEGMPRFTGGAVGALAYDTVSIFEPTVPLPSADPVGVPLASFIETDLVLVFDHLTHTLAAIASLHTDAPRLEERYRVAERALFEALEQTARPSVAELVGPPPAGAARAGVAGVAAAPAAPSAALPPETSLGRDAYEAAVRNAKGAIAAGEAIQVVLARRQTIPLPARADGRPVDGIGLYRSLRKVNPSPYLFFVRTPSFEVVGASPELLLQVEGERMTTHPIAGTRPRGADAREDELLAEQLQADPKERAEHVMLVDLGRNDLGRVARPGTVRVSKYMEVERYSHVLHLVSHVEGKLAPGLDALDALRSVFPAGTLSGAPKVRAMQLIAAAEGERRGLYGGAVGYLGYDGNLDTAIAIRSAVLKEGAAHVHAGAGIVAGSVPEREYEETEHKAAAMRRAIELAAGVAPAPGGPAGAGPGEGPDAAGPRPVENPAGASPDPFAEAIGARRRTEEAR
jgi:anthranilate synthase component I